MTKPKTSANTGRNGRPAGTRECRRCPTTRASTTPSGWSKGVPSGWLRGMLSGWSRGLRQNSGSLPESFLSAVPGGRRPLPREVHPLVANGLPALLSAGRVDAQGYIRPTTRLTGDVTMSRQALRRGPWRSPTSSSRVSNTWDAPVLLAPAHTLFVRREGRNAATYVDNSAHGEHFDHVMIILIVIRSFHHGARRHDWI